MKKNMMTSRLAIVLSVVLAGAALLRAADPDRRVVDDAKAQDKAALKTLIQQKADVNAPAADGMSALAWAAHWDDAAMAEALLQAGADANRANDYGVTPLELACAKGSAAMVSRLLRAALSGSSAPGTTPPAPVSTVAGFRPFPAQGGQLVTNDQIDQLRDEAGL